jgi:flagellar basal body-associated protein FliL
MKVLKVNLDKTVQVGISLPMNSSNVFPTTLSNREQVKSNLLNYILTNKGERLYRPEFGTDIRKKLFEPNTDFEVFKEVLFSDIGKQFIEEIDLEDIVIESDIKTDVVKIAIVYTLKSEFEPDLIQLTFD